MLNDAAVSATITLTKEKYRLRTEIAVHTRGDHVLRGNGEGNALGVSVRQATDKIEQQAQTLKGKWDGPQTQGRAQPASVADGAGGAGPGAAPRIVRATRYPVKPMSVDDAALRVDGGGGVVPGVPQRGHRSGQHPLPSQGRQPRADRAGLVAGLHDCRRDADVSL